MRLETLKINI